jgi:hypothetical protein
VGETRRARQAFLTAAQRAVAKLESTAALR